jgi:phage anti-repressor protein
MNDLISITKNTINGAEVNSVNLRDLHNSLKSKRQFADYAKGRLGRFIENEDFTVHKFVNGKATQIDYIVTIETAKMIAMMENNEIGDKIRRYFIELEKQANMPKQLTTMEMIAEMAINASKVEKQLLEQSDRLKVLEDTSVINSRDQLNIQNAVSAKVSDLIKKHSLNDSNRSKIFASVYKQIKSTFKIGSYKDLPKVQLDNAYKLIESTTIKVSV